MLILPVCAKENFSWMLLEKLTHMQVQQVIAVMSAYTLKTREELYKISIDALNHVGCNGEF